MSEPTLIKDIDVNEWVFQKPKPTNSGSVAVYVDASVSNSQNPRIELPKMKAVWGISHTDHLGNPLAPTKRRNMELDVTDDIVFEKCKAIDDRIIEWVAANCKKVFKKEFSASDLRRMMFKPSIKPSNNPTYNPKLRIKVAPGDDKRSTKIFKMNDDTYEKNGDMNDVTRGSQVVVIMEVASIWFTANQFGATYKATEIAVWSKNENASPFPFKGINGVKRKMCDDDAAHTNASTAGKKSRMEDFAIDTMCGDSDARYV